ncbi:lipase maturation factor family protein [Streptomyces aidingensis]|uniref:Lipase maturation factor n=1 Tax=Streptomyces aidingensis TaxID=910347 RepID=A0A1I1N9G7_9ACTN|nr:lipase maturation factor family protein [Streptomyces aidingensis]SFC91413.1 Lipase maturation factor [Streptomyces aidingensis]
MEWFDLPDAWLGRLLLQRGLALIYLMGFLGAALQFRPLAGERGLTPAPGYLRRVPFRRSPSLFHLHYSDRFLGTVAWTGAALSAALLLGLADLVPLPAAMAAWAVLWALYLSIVNIGQIWYSFGWESLLLEAGFLAIFLGNDETSPPRVTLLLFVWLLFRVEFGAGLIKWRGDTCWRKLTCLYFHHETQPMPSPLSWYFHRLPAPLHRIEAAANHVTQLGVPFLLFFPQPIATLAAAVVVITQLWLIASGNFAWLNWLTIVLAFAAADLSFLLAPPAPAPATPAWFTIATLVLAVLVAVLSYRPVRNLLSPRQQMNRSYDSLHLVNTYGAFGTVTRQRHEVVLEGTDDPVITPDTRWREYEFRGKPGDPGRMPRQFAPYHLRLDWLMWFAALSPAYARTWLRPLAQRLLAGDRPTLRLLRTNPFPDRPPAHVRARLYRYRFTTRQERRATGDWWHRTPVREYLPPLPR